jgi:serine/threonine protein kinase/tetratricopeptide (TPR) repeat protein
VTTPTAVPSPVPPSLPARFGPFLVRGVLGKGGMGVVYRAAHQQTGEAVAVKTVNLPRRSSLAGIRSEIAALGRLDHPGIVAIRGHGVEGGVPWYAMELLEGRTLSNLLKELWPAQVPVDRTTSTAAEVGPVAGWPVPSPLPPTPFPVGGPPRAAAGRMPEVVRLFRQIAETLTYLHGRGIVHRDVKPGNIFVRASGAPVLMDFGLIWRARGSVGREALELGGHLVGTYVYLSPEQVSRQAIDGRSDLYSLGIMLYEAVVGEVPFKGPGGEQIMRQHLVDRPVPPSELVQGMDPRLESLIMRLLAKKRRDRMGHAEDVARCLAEIEGGPPPALPASRGQAYLYRPDLVGREEVLRELAGHINDLQHRKGAFVCLAGESGIGKTFVAGEATALAARRGLRVIGGECLPPSPQVGSLTMLERRGLAMQPLRPFFEALADYCRERGADRVARLLGPRAKIIAGHVPAIADLPGVAELPEPVDLPPEEAHRRLVDSVRETMAAFAAEDHPLLLVLDDLQWADELSLKLLQAMSPEWLKEKGILILGTYRSDEVGPELRSVIDRPGVRSIVITRMDASTVGQIAADMMSVPAVPETLVSFLCEHSEGVPFFVAEYLRAAVSQGLLVRDSGHWTLRGGSLSLEELRSLPLPRSIHDMMVQRLGGVGEELRAVAEVGAVIGREFDVELLAASAGLSEDVATERAKELVRRQIFEAPEIGRYRFVHDKLRETAYASLPPDRREQLHRELAELLERHLLERRESVPYGELGHHFKQGKVWDKAIDYLEKAGDQAVARFANGEAIEFFTLALSVVDKLPVGLDRLRLARWERHLVDSHLSLGQMPAAQAHAERALRLSGFRLPSSRLGWVAGLCGQVLLRGLQRFLPGLFRVRSVERRAFTDLAAYVLNRLCEPFFLSHQPVQGFYCGLRDLNLAERVPPSEALARGYATMAMVVGVGAFTKIGRTWTDRAIGIARAIGAENALVYCLSRSGCLLMTMPEWHTGMERVEEADGKARARGDMRQLGETVTSLGLLTGFRGDFARSLAAGEETVKIGLRRGDEQLCHWGRNLSVHALARLGRGQEALALIRVLAHSHQTQSVGEGEKIFDLGGFALTHLVLGELEEALRNANRVREMIRTQPFLPYFLKGGVEGMCEVYAAVLERADADGPGYRKLLAEGREAITRLEKFSKFYAVARPRAGIHTGQLLWREGHTQKALLAWARALALAESYGMDYDAARARLEIGRHLEEGRVEAGADRHGHLDQARATFARVGATYDLARADGALEERR